MTTLLFRQLALLAAVRAIALGQAPAFPAVAIFAGVVVDSAQTPLPGVQVALPDLSQATVTSKSGAFRFDSVPAGLHRVLARRIGFGPTDTVLRFAAGATVERRIVLTRVVQLDSVKSSGELAPADFQENRRVGLGHFLAREDLAKMEAQSLAAIMDGLPGTKIVQGRFLQTWLVATRRPSSFQIWPDMVDSLAGARPNCYAAIYLDGLLVFDPGKTRRSRGKEYYSDPLFDLRDYSPDRIEALEWYVSPAEMPMKYSTTNSDCGVLVIWSRRSQLDAKR